MKEGREYQEHLRAVSHSIPCFVVNIMSFAALRDKRSARRDPSAVGTEPVESSAQPQPRQPAPPTTTYADLLNDLLEIRTSASAGRTIHAHPSADTGALKKGTLLDS